MTKAMHGGLALLSALPERFTVTNGLQFAPSVDAVTMCGISLQQGTLKGRAQSALVSPFA
jgi:hypothetical protein